MPLYYRKKESFGDADILVVGRNDYSMRDYIIDTFKPVEIFHNGNCWSFDYKELQIDIITSSEEHFDSNFNYLCYNDLGNFIGRIAQGFGMKYGQEGLWLEYQFREQNIGTIPLSKDMKAILEFLDLSYDKFAAGFDTLEEIFEFIADSMYFNWKKFQLDELNKINRDRNKKRKSYMSFLEWVADNVADDKHEHYFYEDKTKYFQKIDNAFPDADLITEIRRLEYEHTRDLYIKAKFNGGMVMRKYGLEGKELGQAITGFKECISSYPEHGGYENFILNATSIEIFNWFDYYLKNRK